MEIWPNFFVVGAPKAGTTSLYHYLKQIPGFYLSPIKEPHFFCPETAEKERIPAVSTRLKYLRLFAEAGDAVARGEFSTAYLRAPEAPGRIHEEAPDAKIIICLRNPVSRTYSHFWMYWRNGNEIRTFQEALEQYKKGVKDNRAFADAVIASSMYFRQVKAYIETFGRENVHFVLFEELCCAPEEVVRGICRFLKVDDPVIALETKAQNTYFEPRNRLALAIVRNPLIRKTAKWLFPRQFSWKVIRVVFGKEREKPEMTPEQCQYLTQLFHEEVDKLEQLLGQEFPWAEFKLDQERAKGDTSFIHCM
jgi:hypothetical protein